MQHTTRSLLRGTTLVFLLVVVLGSVASGEVVITEVMNDPSGNDGFSSTSSSMPLPPCAVSSWSGPGNTEWVEILNVGPGTVDISDWILQDNQGQLGILRAANSNDGSTPCELEPGEFAVLIPEATMTARVATAASMMAAWNIPAPPACEIIPLEGWSSAQLNNSESDVPIELLDSSMTLMDSARYGSTGSNGESLFICTNPLPTTMDNDQTADWNPMDFVVLDMADRIPNPGDYDTGFSSCVRFGTADVATPGRLNPLRAPCMVCSDVALIRSVATASSVVSQDQSQVLVLVTVESLSMNPVTVNALALSFTDPMAVDLTSEYTVTPDPGNPTMIAAGATAFFLFRVDVDVAATPTDVVIDASGDFTDGTCMNMDAEADSIDSWIVLQCLTGAFPLCGDCDADNRVTIVDAFLVARIGAGLAPSPPPGGQKCDVSLDGTYTVLDALMIAQNRVGLLPRLVCCDPLAGLGVAPQPGDVLVNEILPVTEPGIAQSNGEWLELINVSPGIVTLAGHEVFVDGATFALPGSVIPLPSGGTYVITRSGDFALNGGVLTNEVWSGFDLLDTGSNVGLRLAGGGTVVHEITYDDGTDWPFSQGRSAQLEQGLTNPVAAQDFSNWCEGDGVYGPGGRGTPGGTNILCSGRPPVFGDLVISEFMPQPVASASEAEGEYIELRNTTAETLQLANLEIRDLLGGSSGSFFVPTTGFALPPGGRLLLAGSADPMQNGGINPDFAWVGSGIDLENSGDRLFLFLNGSPLGDLEYDSAAWPYAAGVAAGLSDNIGDPVLASYPGWWCSQSSSLVGGDLGTAGAANDTCVFGAKPTVGSLIITEIMPFPMNPSMAIPERKEWFEIKNVSGGTLDIRGIEITIGATSETFFSPAPISLAPGEAYVIGDNEVAGLNGGWSSGLTRFKDFYVHALVGEMDNVTDTVEISASGATLHSITYDATWPFAEGVAAQLDPAVSAPAAASDPMNWCVATNNYGSGGDGTPAQDNDSCPNACGVSPNSCGDLVLNEINAEGQFFGDDTSDFVEVHNPTGGSVDLVSDGYVLVFFDEATGSSYAAVDLGTGPGGATLDPDCHYLVAGCAAMSTLGAPMPEIFLEPVFGIPNCSFPADEYILDGAHAVALYKNCSQGMFAAPVPASTPPVGCMLVDAVVYTTDGSTAPGLLGDFGLLAEIDESAGGNVIPDTIQRDTDAEGCFPHVPGDWATRGDSAGAEN